MRTGPEECLWAKETAGKEAGCRSTEIEKKKDIHEVKRIFVRLFAVFTWAMRAPSSGLGASAGAGEQHSQVGGNKVAGRPIAPCEDFPTVCEQDDDGEGEADGGGVHCRGAHRSVCRKEIGV